MKTRSHRSAWECSLDALRPHQRNGKNDDQKHPPGTAQFSRRSRAPALAGEIIHLPIVGRGEIGTPTPSPPATTPPPPATAPPATALPTVTPTPTPTAAPFRGDSLCHRRGDYQRAGGGPNVDRAQRQYCPRPAPRPAANHIGRFQENKYPEVSGTSRTSLPELQNTDSLGQKVPGTFAVYFII